MAGLRWLRRKFLDNNDVNFSSNDEIASAFPEASREQRNENIANSTQQSVQRNRLLAGVAIR